jgi:hypothetical protein
MGKSNNSYRRENLWSRIDSKTRFTCSPVSCSFLAMQALTRRMMVQMPTTHSESSKLVLDELPVCMALRRDLESWWTLSDRHEFQLGQ